MFKHVVMWTLKDEVEGIKKDKIALDFKEKVEQLKDKISEVIDIEVGINVYEGEFDVVLYSTFNNEEDYKVYANHPEHLKVVDYVKKVVTKRAAVDYKA